MRQGGAGGAGARARADAVWLAALFASGAALRLAHLATIVDSPFFRHLMLDSRMYDDWGLAVAGGAWIGSGPFFQDPLYAYFLGAVYAIFGHDHVALVVIQSVLGALVAPLVYDAARPWFGRASAAVAGTLAALYAPGIYYDALVMKSWMTVVLVALVLWMVSRALAQGAAGRGWWAATGLTLGLACLTRGNLVLLVPAFAAWLFLASPGAERAAWSRRAGLAALPLLAGAAAALLPATVHNRIAGGEWILATANAGQNFYIGNNPFNDSGEYQFLSFVDPNPKNEARDFRREAERRAGRELSPTGISRFWFREARTWIRNEPGDWLRLLWKKTRVFWGAYEVPDNLDYALYREDAPVLRLPLPGFGLLAPFGLLGAILALGRPGWPRLLVGLVAIYSVSVVAFFVLSRFRMAMTPALFALGGFAGVESVRRIRAALFPPRVPAPAVRAGAMLLALVAFVHIPVRGRADALEVRLARAVGLPVRVETSATARFNLGVTYAAVARDADDPAPLLHLAEEQLRTSVREDGRFAAPYIELGKVLAREHRDREAIEAYREAERIEPRNYRIQHALGILYERLGEPAKAVAAYRQALALEPRFSASARNLARLLGQMTQPAAPEPGTPPSARGGASPPPDR